MTAVFLAAAMTILPAFSSLAADERIYPADPSLTEGAYLPGIWPEGFMPGLASPSDMGGNLIPGPFQPGAGEVPGAENAGGESENTADVGFEGIPGENPDVVFDDVPGELFGDIPGGIFEEIREGIIQEIPAEPFEGYGEEAQSSLEDESAADTGTEQEADEEDGDHYAKLLFYDFGKMPSEADLFSGYIDSLFFDDMQDRPFSNNRLTRFAGDERDFYVALTDFTEEIAAGDEEFPVFDARNTAPSVRLNRERLDLADSAANIEWYEAAMNYYLKNVLNVRQIINAVYNENPYNFYWAEGTYVVSFSAYIENGSCVISMPAVYFPANDDYIGDYAGDLSDADGRYRVYNVSNDEIPQARFAAGTAHETAKEHTAEPVEEMLSSFRDEICGMVSCDTDPSEMSDFDDPWQIIYVFDGDPLTTANSEGYARAFQSLCDINGIDTCYTVTGTLSGRPHMWNVLALDDELYLVDLALSDAGMTGENGGLFMVPMDDALYLAASVYTFNPTGALGTEYTFDAREARWEN